MLDLLLFFEVVKYCLELSRSLIKALVLREENLVDFLFVVLYFL